VSTGIITTVAGTGVGGFSGDNGLATSAQLNAPVRVSVDVAGNIYIADFANHRIRKVNTSGIITTIAGTGASGFSGDGSSPISAQFSSPTEVISDITGTLYISDRANNRIQLLNDNNVAEFHRKPYV
jgi:hypothetical protein